jgi:hypothetical protein
VLPKLPLFGRKKFVDGCKVELLVEAATLGAALLFLFGVALFPGCTVDGPCTNSDRLTL